MEDKRFEDVNNWDDVTKLLADMAMENSKDSKSMARTAVEQAKHNVRGWSHWRPLLEPMRRGCTHGRLMNMFLRMVTA